MQSTVLTLETPLRSGPRSATRMFGALLLGLTVAIGPAHFAHARGAPESFADLAEKISPAVVNITTSAVIETASEDMPRLPEGSPFRDVFDQFQNPDGEGGGPRRSEALGSGCVISEDGSKVMPCPLPTFAALSREPTKVIFMCMAKVAGFPWMTPGWNRHWLNAFRMVS